MNDVLSLIGNTPVVKLKNSNIYAKCEFLNPSGSVKDRAAYFMLKDALESKAINDKSIIVEPTSGNTGISLAMVCAVLGLELILTMPESMSVERRKMMQVYGAKLVLTPASLGMKGAIEKANEIVSENENSFMPMQFENLSNVKAHEQTTALEILKDVPNIDIFVAGVGTGGTISGVGKILKQKNPNVKIIAVEPEESAVLSGQGPSPHKIQGIGAGFVPKILAKDYIDEVITINSFEAIETMNTLPKQEGLFVGISSGANVYAAKKLAKDNPDKNIVTILCDYGARYLSVI
jgi:cysteine synthase A